MEKGGVLERLKDYVFETRELSYVYDHDKKVTFENGKFRWWILINENWSEVSKEEFKYLLPDYTPDQTVDKKR